MITHQIVVHQRPVKTIVIQGKKQYPKFVGIQGTTDHRKYLHKRGLHFNDFDKYDTITWRKKSYMITDIIEDFELVSWDGLSPKFIEILDKDGSYYYVNPGDLKKARRAKCSS